MFLKICSLKDSRLALGQVMDLLQAPVIRDKFDIKAGEQEILHTVLRRAGVMWGKDPDHRMEVAGKGYRENTWQFGLERLFMGYAMAESSRTLVAGILPCDAFEGLDAELLGKLTCFVHTLFTVLTDMSGSRSIQAWGRCFNSMVQLLMASNPDTENDIGFLLNEIGCICPGRAGRRILP